MNDFYVKIKGRWPWTLHLNKDPNYSAVHFANSFYRITGKEIAPCNKSAITIVNLNPELLIECLFHSGTFRCLEENDKECQCKKFKNFIFTVQGFF